MGEVLQKNILRDCVNLDKLSMGVFYKLYKNTLKTSQKDVKAVQKTLVFRWSVRLIC